LSAICTLQTLFLFAHGDPRHLPSFPTRRSSDLLLDQLPGGVAAHGRDVQGALLVYVDLSLGEPEVESARADALLAQLLGEVEEDLDVTLELALAGRQPPALGELLDLLVGQAGVGLDDR